MLFRSLFGIHRDVAVGAKIAMDTKQLNKILLVTGGGLAMIALVALSRRR